MAEITYYIALKGPVKSMRRIPEVLESVEEEYPSRSELVIPANCLAEIQTAADGETVSVSWCSEPVYQSSESYVSDPLETLMEILPELKAAVILEVTRCGIDCGCSLFSAAGSSKVRESTCLLTDDEDWSPDSDEPMRQFSFPKKEKEWLDDMWTKKGWPGGINGLAF